MKIARHSDCLKAVERKIPLWTRLQWRARGVGYQKVTAIVVDELTILQQDRPAYLRRAAATELARRVRKRLEREYSSLWITLAVAIAMKIIEILIAEWWQ